MQFGPSLIARPFAFAHLGFNVDEQIWALRFGHSTRRRRNANTDDPLTDGSLGIVAAERIAASVGLTNFHAKKRDLIAQEVFARIIMYNFAEMITLHVVITHTDTKYAQQVNFTSAIHISKRFLRLPNHETPIDVEALIHKNTLPVRPDRKDERKIRSKSAISFVYRVA